MNFKKWVLERGTEPPAYSPWEEETGAIVIGLTVIGGVPDDAVVVGEFWFDEEGQIEVRFYGEVE